MAKQVLSFTLNGEETELLVQPYHTLLETLRANAGLTGAKEGCGTGDCGACSVLLNGRVTCSCLVFSPEADGATITTVDGRSARPRHFAILHHRRFSLASLRALLDSIGWPSLRVLPAGGPTAWQSAALLCRRAGYSSR